MARHSCCTRTISTGSYFSSATAALYDSYTSESCMVLSMVMRGLPLRQTTLMGSARIGHTCGIAPPCTVHACAPSTPSLFLSLAKHLCSPSIDLSAPTCG